MSTPPSENGPRDFSLSPGESGTAISERLSILLVNYNGIRHIEPCLESVSRFAPSGTQVILEDNASTDGSVEAVERKFPGIEIVRSGRNRGFSGGNNLAGGRARGRFILLLNIDTLLLEPIAPVVDWLEEHPSYGALTIKMLDGGQNSSACTGRFPSPRRLALLRTMLVPPHEYGADHAYDVDWVQGSFLLIRADLWRKLNGLDERYFMYAEDVDLCRRIWNTGLKCAYLPHLQYLHWGGFEPSRFPDQVGGLATYVERHMTGPRRLLSWVVLFGGCILRTVFYYTIWCLRRSDIDSTKAMSSWNAFKVLIKRHV